jgi:hypothetical protein
MKDTTIEMIRGSYDQLVDEYARRFLNELEHKPLDRELLSRFAAQGGRARRGEGFAYLIQFPDHVVPFPRYK